MNQKLKIRLQTAVVFIIIMLLGIFAHKYTAVALMGIISLGGAYEYGKITHTSNTNKLLTWCCSLIGFIIPFFWTGQDAWNMLVLLALTFTIVAIINLYTRKRMMPHGHQSPLIAFLNPDVTLGLMAKCILDVRVYQPIFLISIFGFIWISDSAAYLVGSQIGKTKLFESVSPNKTWEGSLGAGFFTLLLGLALYYSVGMFTLPTYLLLAISVWVFGTYGDLVESSIKREYLIKDSGAFMPGHGGFLDRFDSFIFVIPIVLLLIDRLS